MSLNIVDIKKAIYSTLTGDATLMALITGIYGRKVPDGVDYPYVQFLWLPTPSVDNFANFRDELHLQINCCAEDTELATSQETSGLVAYHVTRILDDNTEISITDYEVPCCERTNSVEDLDPITDIYYNILEYKITVSKSKRS